MTDAPLTTSTSTKAFFWIAAGATYVQEAARSAETVRALHPDCDRFLISPDTARGVPSVFNFYVTAPEQRGPFWFLDSTRYMLFALKALEAYRNLIYLDTDTRVIKPLDDIFALQSHFDFTGGHAPGRVTRPTIDPVPPSFPEINIGVNGIRNSLKVRTFVRDWLKRYEDNATFYGNNDQASLREALWGWHAIPEVVCPSCGEEIDGVWETYGEERLIFYVTPPEYNFRFGFGGWARYPIHVLHGRTQDWPALIKAVNEDAKGFRGWMPGELP